MGLFKKKPDPINERARSLNDQIAALEAEIQRLSVEPMPLQGASKPARESTAARESRVPSLSTPAQPRLRSTAKPLGAAPHEAHARAPDPPPELVFEPVEQSRLKEPTGPSGADHFNELGVRKYDLAGAWQRFKNHFRGPETSNPRLVNYLAAGSIQGLRPLRYEKRVARNRFLVLVAVLVLALWGIIYIYLSRR